MSDDWVGICTIDTKNCLCSIKSFNMIIVKLELWLYSLVEWSLKDDWITVLLGRFRTIL